MNRVRRCIHVFSAAAIAAVLSAPPAEAAVTLGQEQAVAMGLGRHPAVRAAGHGIEAARARTSQTHTAWLPRVKVEGSYMAIGPVQDMVIDTGIAPPPPFGGAPIIIEKEIGSLHNAAVGVSAAWRAFEAGATAVRTEAAEALERAAEADAEQQRVQIAYAVRAAYLAARFFQELDTTTGASLALARAELREEEARRAAGLGSDLDLARVRMRAAELEARAGQASQERARAQTTLRLLLGLEPGAELRLSDDLKTLAGAPLGPAPRTDAHPLRRTVAALEQAAERDRSLKWRAYWPTLDVVGAVKYQYPKNYFETDQAGPTYSAGAVLTWIAFDGDLLRRQIAESDAKLAELYAKEQAADEEIRRQLADAEAQIRTSETAASAAERTLEAAQIYERAARAALGAGAGTALELRKATDGVDQARLAWLKACFDGALARAAYLRAGGRARIEEEKGW
ncbi:MAG: TolC family protein [Deltaproteobacteria bacterium]|nr:TolC family protein [Deltaproteobacteria bacterium]